MGNNIQLSKNYVPLLDEVYKKASTTEEFNAVSEGCDVKYRFKYLTFLNRFMP